MKAKKSKVGSLVRFYYQGESHSHPVRRVVVIKEDHPDFYRGYEIRAGNTVRTLEEAKTTIRTYRKDRIAKYGDYSRLRKSKTTRNKNPNQTTLTPLSVLSVLEGTI